jgi:signal transduction histidine kinase
MVLAAEPAARPPGRGFRVLLGEDLRFVLADDVPRRTSGYLEQVSHIRELWLTDRGRLVHYLVAVSLAIFLVVEMAMTEQAHTSQLVLAVAGAIALLFTRDAPFVAPLAVGVVLCGILSVDADAVYDTDAPFLIILFMPWCLGTYNEHRRAVFGLVAFQFLGLYANIQFSEARADYVWAFLFIGVAWTTGFVLSRRSEHARQMLERVRRAELERERAVVDERQRIARELHDVIAHSVSVMTVQTGAVRRLLREDQTKERDALETVEATGRQALTEMRRLVGLLREQGAMPEFSPQPGMDTIDSLLDGVRAAGLPVELEVAGSPQELPPGVDLAAYRVVQEALTNALKYAGPAHAWVAVSWGDDELELTISNDGRSDGDGTSGGQGLDGMRERVSLYGGQIESGPREGGGYVVSARLPIGEGAT